MLDSEKYELKTSLSDLLSTKSKVKLNARDLANTLIKNFPKEYPGYGEGEKKEKILNKIYFKGGLQSELKKIGFQTEIKKMSLEEKHDYLKLLYYLINRQKELELKYSIIAHAKTLKFSISSEANTNIFIKMCAVLNGLEIGIRKQSMKSSFDNINKFFDRIKNLQNFQLCLKSIEKNMVENISDDIYDIVNKFKNRLEKAISNSKDNQNEMDKYTIMERMYIYLAFQILKAIFLNKKDAIIKIKNFDSQYSNNIAPSIIQYYREIYNNYICKEVNGAAEYKKTLSDFFDEHINEIRDIVYLDVEYKIENKKRDIVGKKENIINMVLLSVEQINPTFTGMCRVELIFPATYLIMRHFNSKGGGSERIIDMRQKDDDSSKSNRITSYLRKYMPGEFSPNYAEIISNMLFYGNAMFLGDLKHERDCWEFEIYLSDIALKVCENMNLSLVEDLNHVIFSFESWINLELFTTI